MDKLESPGPWPATRVSRILLFLISVVGAGAFAYWFNFTEEDSLVIDPRNIVLNSGKVPPPLGGIPPPPSGVAPVTVGPDQPPVWVVESLVRNALSGSAAVNVPKSAKRGEAFTAYLRVAPTDLDEVLKKLREAVPGDRTSVGKEGVKLLPRMTGMVSGAGFSVVPKDGYVQAVSSTEPTTWVFQVEPERWGVLTLQFRLAGVLLVDGKDAARDFYHYDQTVDVAVGWAGLVQQNWQWFASTLVLPAVAGIWVWWRNKKPKAPSTRVPLRDRVRKR